MKLHLHELKSFLRYEGFKLHNSVNEFDVDIAIHTEVNKRDRWGYFGINKTATGVSAHTEKEADRLVKIAELNNGRNVYCQVNSANIIKRKLEIKLNR